MLIRPCSDDDDLVALVDAAQADCTAPMVPPWRRGIHLHGDRALIAESNGEPVGLASCHTPQRHPRMTEIAVDLVSRHRTPQVADALVDSVLALTGDCLIATKTADNDPMSHWVRSRPDFRHEITVRYGTMATSNQPAPPHALPVGYAAEIFDEVTRPLEELYETVYAESHAWTGEAVPSTARGSLLSLVGEPVAIGVVWNRTGSPVAISAVTLGSDRATGAFLVPGGVVVAEPMHRGNILAHAIDVTLRAAARAGVTVVEYEDSRPDWSLQGEVLDRFPRTDRQVTEIWLRRP